MISSSPVKKGSISSTLSILSLLAIIFLIYSSTFKTPWVLDDPPNITNNAPLRINNLMPETLWQTLYAKPFAPGSLYRPVANLSFALNWYVGQDNPFGYHVVNLLVHILTSLLLFKTVLLLFETPVLKNYSQQDVFFITLLGTTLWAIHPIQTQAVTYIVQRMASLAAMFYIWAIFWYLKFRLTKTSSNPARRLLICVLCYLCAIGSKENAAILPLSILLIEFIFFPKTPDTFSINIRRILLIALFAIGLYAFYYIIQHNYFANLFKPIGSRPFTIYERLLTEPRIVLFYLSLIFYPLSQRLSVDHDITIAHTLFGSWATVPSILIILVLIFWAITNIRKRPILSFAILFFFINHLIESTIIPLELIFEHRNYLPSMFLFIPVAAGLLHLLKIYSQRNKTIYAAIIIFIPLLLTAIGWNTYLRNNVWASEQTLWLDALKKAPNNARPLAKLGELAGWNEEKNEKQLALAIGYYQKALTSYSPRTSFKAAILGNMGEIFFMYGLHDQAISYYSKSLALNPNFNNSQYGLAKTLVVKGKFDNAIKEIDSALKTDTFQSRFLNLGGLVLLWQNRPDDAISAISQAMRINRNKQKYFYNLGVAFSRAGYYNQAEWFLKLSSTSHIDLRILFSLLENSIRSNNEQQTAKITDTIINNFSITHIENKLKHLHHDYYNVPVSVDLIAPVIWGNIREKAFQSLDVTKHYP